MVLLLDRWSALYGIRATATQFESHIKTDNFGCLFFFVLWLMMQTIRLAAYTCLALFVFASELAGNHLKPQPAVWSASLQHCQSLVAGSALLTGVGLRG